jgi:hypothetical protein
LVLSLPIANIRDLTHGGNADSGKGVVVEIYPNQNIRAVGNHPKRVIGWHIGATVDIDQSKIYYGISGSGGALIARGMSHSEGIQDSLCASGGGSRAGSVESIRRTHQSLINRINRYPAGEVRVYRYILTFRARRVVNHLIAIRTWRVNGVKVAIHMALQSVRFEV